MLVSFVVGFSQASPSLAKTKQEDTLSSIFIKDPTSRPEFLYRLARDTAALPMKRGSNYADLYEMNLGMRKAFLAKTFDVNLCGLSGPLILWDTMEV